MASDSSPHHTTASARSTASCRAAHAPPIPIPCAPASRAPTEGHEQERRAGDAPRRAGPNAGESRRHRSALAAAIFPNYSVWQRDACQAVRDTHARARTLAHTRAGSDVYIICTHYSSVFCTLVEIKDSNEFLRFIFWILDFYVLLRSFLSR